MKIRLIILATTGSVLVAFVLLFRNGPYIPSERNLLAAARSVETFADLEREKGNFEFNVIDAVVKRHTAYHGWAEIVGIDDGTLSWSYYPANRDLIITRITVDGRTLYELDREQIDDGNSVKPSGDERTP